jgi:hypothetical protein
MMRPGILHIQVFLVLLNVRDKVITLFEVDSKHNTFYMEDHCLYSWMTRQYLTRFDVPV